MKDQQKSPSSVTTLQQGMGWGRMRRGRWRKDPKDRRWKIPEAGREGGRRTIAGSNWAWKHLQPSCLLTYSPLPSLTEDACKSHTVCFTLEDPSRGRKRSRKGKSSRAWQAKQRACRSGIGALPEPQQCYRLSI